MSVDIVRASVRLCPFPLLKIDGNPGIMVVRSTAFGWKIVLNKRLLGLVASRWEKKSELYVYRADEI